ncbi:MAG: molybdopterin molybdotransferase MoeA [Planctomycetes bacterium]|nr:molybdopterin molybdotransferase MoeA [Planctomycetota bacterium]
MLTVEEALELVVKNVEPLAARRVSLGEAAGLVLAEEIRSEVNSPPYDKALMDGYAVRSGDRQPERQILEEIAAGAVPRFPVTPGAASRIMTGAPLPEGADAVVQLERTELVSESTVRLRQVDPLAGQNVLPLGAALRAGEVVLQRGVVLRPVEIGILAEMGRGVVSAIPRPRVAVLPTGNELVAVGEKPEQGQIRNSNGPLLAAAAARAGAHAIELGIARDKREKLRRWVEQGLVADVLVLSGGVSAGKFDLVPEVLAELGVEQVFHKISLRPGKPLWFGVKHDGERRVLVFGLPGNPVSSFVCFELFVRPAIAAMAGRGFEGLPTVRARLTHAFVHAGGRESFLPATVSGVSGSVLNVAPSFESRIAAASSPADLWVAILPWQGSADLVTLARANGLVRLSAAEQQLNPGTLLDVILI